MGIVPAENALHGVYRLILFFGVLFYLTQFLELSVPFPAVERDSEEAQVDRWQRELTPAGQKEIIALLAPLISRWGHQI